MEKKHKGRTENDSKKAHSSWNTHLVLRLIQLVENENWTAESHAMLFGGGNKHSQSRQQQEEKPNELDSASFRIFMEC